MKSCCLQGYEHAGEPTGTVTALHDLPVYIAEPPDDARPKAVIVFLPDAFGWDMPNNRLLADRYARRTGARVYLPDFMDGGAFPAHMLGTMATVINPADSWLAVLTHRLPAILRFLGSAAMRITSLGDANCRPRVIGFLSALRRNEARGLKIGVAGFCWGGHHAFDLCAGITDPDGTAKADGEAVDMAPDPPTLVDAAFTAHPSNISAPGDFERAKLPLCVAIGDSDFAFSRDKCELGKRVLDAKGDADRYRMDIIEGARHGFAMRWNPDDDTEMRMARHAEDMAISFWARWLGTDDVE